MARADVSHEAELAGVLAQVERSGSPLRGVVHAAGVVDDGILLQLDAERFRSVMASKVQGAWNLHTLTAGTPLDFFVMFSSVASFLISAGHGNYAAANAFLDSLAAYRRSQGLAATSINWGPWEIGLAAAASQSDRLDRLSDRGLTTLTSAEGMAALATLIEQSPARIAVMHFDAPKWCSAPDLTTSTALFTRLVGEAKAETSVVDTSVEEISLTESLLAVDAGPARRRALEAYVQEQVARVLRLAPSRIDTNKAFRTMGLDSLMGLEFRNRLEARTGLTIPATLVWNYPTVTQLATELAGRIGVPLDAAEARTADSSGAEAMSPEHDGDLAALLGEIEDLSDEDARRLLAE